MVLTCAIKGFDAGRQEIFACPTDFFVGFVTIFPLQAKKICGKVATVVTPTCLGGSGHNLNLKNN